MFLKNYEYTLNLMEEHNVAYELNTSGLRKSKFNHMTKKEFFDGWSYPSLDAIRLSLNKNIDFVSGSDAHTPQDVGTGIREVLLKSKEVGLDKICFFENRKKVFFDIFDCLGG